MLIKDPVCILIVARFALPSITMAYPASHLWWCRLSSANSFAAPGFLGRVSSNLLEITAVQSVSTNWQILPSDDVFYIRNEAAGPHFQLGLSSPLSTAEPRPSLVSINQTREQQWTLSLGGNGVRIQNVALGDFGLLNVSNDGLELSFAEWGKSEKTWNIKPVTMIDDASFLTNAQIPFIPSIRSVPNDTSSADPATEHYIPVGPAAAAVALGIAVVCAVCLWRFSPMRRKRQQPQSQVELAVVNCAPEEPAHEAREPLPQYHANGNQHQSPPPVYSARVDGAHPPVNSRPPEYRPTVG